MVLKKKVKKNRLQAVDILNGLKHDKNFFRFLNVLKYWKVNVLLIQRIYEKPLDTCCTDPMAVWKKNAFFWKIWSDKKKLGIWVKKSDEV